MPQGQIDDPLQLIFKIVGQPIDHLIGAFARLGSKRQQAAAGIFMDDGDGQHFRQLGLAKGRAGIPRIDIGHRAPLRGESIDVAGDGKHFAVQGTKWLTRSRKDLSHAFRPGHFLTL